MIRNEIKLNFSGDKFERTFQNYHSVQVRIVTIWILEAIKKLCCDEIPTQLLRKMTTKKDKDC